MIRDVAKPPSNACARLWWLRPTRSMQCSISRCCCSGKAHMPRRLFGLQPKAWV
jgi:hypothetical protein